MVTENNAVSMVTEKKNYATSGAQNKHDLDSHFYMLMFESWRLKR